MQGIEAPLSGRFNSRFGRGLCAKVQLDQFEMAANSFDLDMVWRPGGHDYDKQERMHGTQKSTRRKSSLNSILLAGEG